MAKITYLEKVATDIKADVPEINKTTAGNLNEIKEKHNLLDDSLIALQANQVDGILRFDTKALLDLETGVPTSRYEVTDDTDPLLNGQYKWNGSSFEKTDLQTLSASDVTDTVTEGSTEVITSGSVFNEFAKKTSIAAAYPFKANISVATDVSRAILDLYVTGLDESLEYAIQYVGKNFSASNLNYFQITQNGVTVASFVNGTSLADPNLSGIVEYQLFPINGSGILGKVVINWDELTSGIRYNDPYPISNYVTQNLFKKVDDVIDFVSKKKYFHFTFDDVILCLEDITTNAGTYTSIFENSFFAWLKQMNDSYGVKFSLFCFYDGLNGFDLSQCTDVFAPEFTANSSWLKLGFHAKNQNTNYISTTALQATTDYNQLINELYRITGSEDCLARVLRLGNYGGNIESCKAFRDADCGIKGLLVSPDVRTNYFLSTDDNEFSNTHATMYDNTSKLTFFKTLLVGNALSIIQGLGGVNYRGVFSSFLHEIELTGGIPSLTEDLFVYAKNNGYNFEFLDDLTVEK